MSSGRSAWIEPAWFWAASLMPVRRCVVSSGSTGPGSTTLTQRGEGQRKWPAVCRSGPARRSPATRERGQRLGAGWGGSGEGGAEVAAGGDAQLGEDLAQVPLDGAGGQEELGADLGVGAAVDGEPGDRGLLGGELGPGRRTRRSRW